MPQRSVLLLALVLAAVTLAVEAPVVLGGETWDDVTYHTQIAPPRFAAAAEVQSGSLPVWWDGTGLGVPLLGEPSHGAAYPGHWIAGTPRSLDVLVLVHLWIAALGIALWARRNGASDVSAVVCGVLVMSTGVLASSALRGSLPALAWLPWIAWARSTRRNSLLGVFVALVALAGDLGVLVDGVALAVLVEPVGEETRGRLRWITAIGCGLAIGALQWLPAIFAMPHIVGTSWHGVRIARFLELFVPMRSPDVSLPSIFVGAPLLALAAACRPSRRMIAFAVMLLVASAFDGHHLAVIAFLAGGHAGTAIDALFAADNEVLAQRRRALRGLVAAAGLTAIAVAALGTLRARMDDSAHRELLDHVVRDGALAFMCAAGAAVLAWRVRINGTPLVVALLLVAPGVLGRSAFAPVTNRDVVDEPAPWVEKALASPSPVRVYRPIKLLENVHDTAPPTLDAEIATLGGASASVWGVDAARSEDPARIAVHDRAWFAAASAGGVLLTRYGIALAILPLASLEGATVSPTDEGGSTTMPELGRRGSWALVRFPASPPAAVVHEWLFMHDTDAELRRLFPPGSKSGLPTGLVILHGEGRENQDEPSPAAACTIERWDAGAIDLVCTARADSAAGAYAVVSSTPMPGWSATVDGRATPWLTADVMRRAVSISAGTHRVQWRYRAPGLTPALVLCALGLLGLLALRFQKS